MSWTDFKEKHDFFSILIAFTALLLSQLPPIYQLFNAPNLVVSDENTIFITPNFPSGISLTKHLTISNDGEEAGRIKSAHIFITDTAGEVYFYSKAFSYASNEVDTFGNTKISSFSELLLPSDKIWSYKVFYSGLLNDFEITKIKDIQGREEEEKEAWYLEMKEQGVDFTKRDRSRPSFNISKDLYEVINKSTLSELYWLEEGRYFIHEVFVSDKNKRIIKSYEFEIDNSKLDELKRVIHVYRNGLNPSVMFGINLSIMPIDTNIKDAASGKIDSAIQNNKKWTGML